MKKLYVIDMINGFCKEGALHDTSILKIVPNIIRELEQIPMDQRVFVVDCHALDCGEFQAFPPHCIKGTRESEIIDELKPFASTIYQKNSTNACHVMDLQKEMDGVDEVIITGCCTDICIMQFALSLKTWINQHDRNIFVCIPHDCVATYDIPDVHDATLFHEFAIKCMCNSGIIIK